MNFNNFKGIITQINEVYETIDSLLSLELEKNESLLGFSKWGS